MFVESEFWIIRRPGPFFIKADYVIPQFLQQLLTLEVGFCWTKKMASHFFARRTNLKTIFFKEIVFFFERNLILSPFQVCPGKWGSSKKRINLIRKKCLKIRKGFFFLGPAGRFHRMNSSNDILEMLFESKNGAIEALSNGRTEFDGLLFQFGLC